MGNSNSFCLAVRIGFVRIRVPHLDARQRRANEIGHPARKGSKAGFVAFCARPPLDTPRSATENSIEAARELRRLRWVKGQPEVRQYRARWSDDDRPFGDWSDIVQVTVRPKRLTEAYRSVD